MKKIYDLSLILLTPMIKLEDVSCRDFLTYISVRHFTITSVLSEVKQGRTSGP